ncbi:MAG TPA: DUF3822 family protein [Candidatus Paraprevotella stercorigallinarum]|nr:DUF3822 family protein [Candidatus Paraprevotella stercorigallinarum]
MQETGNNLSYTNNISIRVHADGFSFYCYTPHSVPAIKKETFNLSSEKSAAESLNEAITQSSMLKQEDKAVYGLISSPSIQIPLEYFKKEEASALFHLTYTHQQEKKIYYNILPHLEVVKIFDIPKETEEVLCSHFPTIRFYHIHTMIMEKTAFQKATDRQQLYIYLHDKEVFLLKYNSQSLHYSNTFPADATDNIIYYILSVWKLLNMDAETDECVFLGEHQLQNGAISALSPYLRNIRTLTNGELYKRSGAGNLPDIPLDVLSLLLNT